MQHLIILILFLSQPLLMQAAADTSRISSDSSVAGNDTVSAAAVNKRMSLKPEFRSATGFRLQVLKTQSRDKALLLKARLLESLAGTRVYLTYQAPFYRLRVGNFLDRKEALQFSRRYLDSIANVFVVRDRVIYTWFPPGWDKDR